MSYAISINGAIVEGTNDCVSTSDRGFLYGDGLFETIRAYQKKPFRLKDHINRLEHSAQFLDIPFGYSCLQIRQIIEQLLTINNLSDAYIRLTLSRGRGANGFIPANYCSPTFVVHTKPFTPYPVSLYESGVTLIISGTYKSTSCPLSRHKTLNFLENYLVKKEAFKAGAHDALILNTDNVVTECTVSNFFIVKNNTVFTPPTEANILPGITRKVVLELCKENNIPVQEEAFGTEKVFAAADEVFITNSLMEIMPVSKIGSQRIGDSASYGITRFLSDKYKELVVKSSKE